MLDTSSSSAVDDAGRRAPTSSSRHSAAGWSRPIRIAGVAVAYGAMVGFAVPVSPMFRLSLPQNPNIMKLVFHSFVASSLASGVAYAKLIDTHHDAQQHAGADQWRIPKLGLLSGMVPGLAALVGCHALYPGFFVIQWEPTWGMRLKEYARLTTKVTFAYSNSHVPYVAAGSAIIGSSCWLARRFTLPERIRIALGREHVA